MSLEFKSACEILTVFKVFYFFCTEESEFLYRNKIK